jgi:lipoyl(octanoyl) transferase
VSAPWDILDLSRLAYAPTFARQRALNRAVSRGEAPPTLVLVEHDPVITVSHRRGVRDHLLASPARLAELGIAVEDTDRGGDITYHGPGQLVVYPILRLNDFGLNLGRYMRALERAVIDTVAAFGIQGHTETGATGVWVDLGSWELGVGSWGKATNGKQDSMLDPNTQHPNPNSCTAKLCALGVRIRKNTTMHGLALNVTTDLSHFETIDPCGLGGRPVTSLQHRLGDACPTMDRVKATLTDRLMRTLEASHPVRDTPS